jgi:GNAT superfamily N-acetyltransferase
MRIVALEPHHLEPARHIAAQNYDEERAVVPALPRVPELPDLTDFAENGLGVAALEGEELVGFLGCYRPWDEAFGRCKGIFSPIHAHGAISRERARIYDWLYQAASQKWVAAGILSHAIGLYAHDREALGSFFDNGFGNRAIDAIRDVSPITAPALDGITIRPVDAGDADVIAALNNGLLAHLRQAPMFLPHFQTFRPEDIAGWIAEKRYRFVAAFDRRRAIAYLRVQDGGENFASDDPDTMNISGAFTLPEVRGSGVSTALLAWLIDQLRDEDYCRCGVDFESFNYTARNFWLKHFTAYTDGVVRRIDERILSD